ncbi:SEC-C domain-containing protein [Arthrobacter gandavensis]|uniref:YchJ family protein n=1 Tax=Arthrobacter gandavensis TaxID=169960 RepID=UPI00188DE685|nr:YchJ family metal-binding protein [Arthrobacter gandavensis]MBF4993156.1 SEC-C domain-containing protein [Arthrobacter gandavensis]
MSFPALSETDRCPCLSGETYRHCCRRFHAGTSPAPTAEALMRSRYTAFVTGDTDYLVRTWHPSSRPAHLDLDPEMNWRRLDIVSSVAGSPLDSTGTVTFEAHYRLDGAHGVQRERSTFVREGGRWLYVAGD